MATTSARSFNSYSGLDRQQQLQQMPSATERLQQPDLFGAGKPGNIAMREAAPWALGLSERAATPSGRSTRDPYRALEMLSRGTARPGQVQAALGLRQLRMQDQDPIDAAREQQFGGGPETPPPPPPVPQPFGGNIFGYPSQAPSNSSSRRAVGSAMSGRSFGRGGIPYRSF